MARFPQLDRLADNEEWVDWRRGERVPNRRRRHRDKHTVPLDELITGDGMPVDTEEDE